MGEASGEKRGRVRYPPCTCGAGGGGVGVGLGVCVFAAAAAAALYKCLQFKTVLWFPLYLKLISGLGFGFGQEEGGPHFLLTEWRKRRGVRACAYSFPSWGEWRIQIQLLPDDI